MSTKLKFLICGICLIVGSTALYVIGPGEVLLINLQDRQRLEGAPFLKGFIPRNDDESRFSHVLVMTPMIPSAFTTLNRSSQPYLLLKPTYPKTYNLLT